MIPAAVAMMALMACDKIEIRRQYHDNGKLAEERAMLITSEGEALPHGLTLRWREDGSRQALDVFNRGVREGYALRWDEGGDLRELLLCEDGVCEEKSRRDSPFTDRALAQFSPNNSP